MVVSAAERAAGMTVGIAGDGAQLGGEGGGVAIRLVGEPLQVVGERRIRDVVGMGAELPGDPQRLQVRAAELATQAIARRGSQRSEARQHAHLGVAIDGLRPCQASADHAVSLPG
jgi:hypothetical protein